MSDVVTDPVIEDTLTERLNDGFADREHDVTNARDEHEQTFAVVTDDAGDSYGYESNSYGQRIWYGFSSRTAADEWFDGVTEGR